MRGKKLYGEVGNLNNVRMCMLNHCVVGNSWGVGQFLGLSEGDP